MSVGKQAVLGEPKKAGGTTQISADLAQLGKTCEIEVHHGVNIFERSCRAVTGKQYHTLPNPGALGRKVPVKAIFALAMNLAHLHLTLVRLKFSLGCAATL